MLNLKEVVRRAKADLCPVRIAEIWVFGSFLRLKEEPGDIDLVVLYREDKEFDARVELFRQFVLEQRKTEEGLKQLEGIVTNAELGAKFGALLGLDVSGWLPYIRTTDFSFFRFLFGPREVTKRVLRAGLHGIQIAEVAPVGERDQVFSQMSTSKFRFLWSREKPELEANLSESFVPQEQDQTLLSELRNFLIQAEQNRSRYEVLAEGAVWLMEKMKLREDVPPESDLNEHMLAFAAKKGVAEKFRSWVLRGGFDGPTAHEHITTLDVEKEVARIGSSGTDGISEACERLREEIKLLRRKARVASVFLNQIVDVSEHRKDLKDRTEIAALRALIWVPVYDASDEVKREVLQDIGLGEISRKIVLVAYPGSKADYFLADSEEYLQELLDRKESGRVANEHVPDLRPILRKSFPPSTFTNVSITTQKNKEGQVIPGTVQLYASSEGSVEAFLQRANELGFQVSKGYEPGSYRASLNLDVSHLIGDRAKIRDLLRRRLANELMVGAPVVKET